MPYRQQQFVNGEIYHVVLRGIDNNIIFKDVDDYYRGIFSIYEFNTAQMIEIRERRKMRTRFKKSQKQARGGPASVNAYEDGRKKLLEILVFCFMPNHIHLLLRQIKKDGITIFMQKVGTGYGGYFNRKYNRKGYVFQNRFSAVHVENEEQLKTVFVYIHANPLSLVEPKWKEKGLRNSIKAAKFLENYKWSSYSDYLNKKNFPSVTDRELLLKIMGRQRGCRDFVGGWLKHKEEIKKFAPLFLE